GGRGLGVMRSNGEGDEAVHERVPRNAPHLFNLGAKEFEFQFHDGRVGIDPSQPSGFSSPAGADLPVGLDNVLAVQAMFPVTSSAEMAGQPGENPIADATAAGLLAGPGGVWDQLAQRLQAVPEYVDRFKRAYPDDIQQASDISYVHAANAIAAFEATAFRADHSPFDYFLQGEWRALNMAAYNGMWLFYGKAECASCHSGKFLTDQSFHAIGMPQIGPGKGDNQPGYSDGHDDLGRERVTGDPADRFKFRTPSLRNIALTAPYGHDGAYDTLEAMVRHHLNPVESLYNYDSSHAALIPRDDLDAVDFVVMNGLTRVDGIAAANELMPVSLTDEEIHDLLAFLRALTDASSLDLRAFVPYKVPSGLPVTE
ncbi:MAG: cytochrome-c peroxidase, partial [Methylothermaceae bacterium]|nr:cytochrome-c peroxidase [Methylothermaceae bacterium]